MKPIFHITTRQDWESAVKKGAYLNSSLDTEGFVHCSQLSQIVNIANLFYQGQSGLILLVIDPVRLKPELKLEKPAGMEDDFKDLFPHIYGPVNIDAVEKTVDFPCDENGSFSLPPELRDTARPAIEEIVAYYQLKPLPVEGTLFTQTYCSSRKPDDASPAGTAMIGLYCDEPRSISLFHKLSADEVWHFYGGDPFRLILLYPDGTSRNIIMGNDFRKGQHIQFVVPAGVWQAGHLLSGGTCALYGCTMAPGFTPDCFLGGTIEELSALYPDRADDIRMLGCESGSLLMPEC